MANFAGGSVITVKNQKNIRDYGGGLKNTSITISGDSPLEIVSASPKRNENNYPQFNEKVDLRQRRISSVATEEITEGEVVDKAVDFIPVVPVEQKISRDVMDQKLIEQFIILGDSAEFDAQALALLDFFSIRKKEDAVQFFNKNEMLKSILVKAIAKNIKKQEFASRLDWIFIDRKSKYEYCQIILEIELPEGRVLKSYFNQAYSNMLSICDSIMVVRDKLLLEKKNKLGSYGAAAQNFINHLRHLGAIERHYGANPYYYNPELWREIDIKEKIIDREFRESQWENENSLIAKGEKIQELERIHTHGEKDIIRDAFKKIIDFKGGLPRKGLVPLILVAEEYSRLTSDSELRKAKYFNVENPCEFLDQLIDLYNDEKTNKSNWRKSLVNLF
ncbi:hypothetical protein QS306_11040 [Paraburkholderia bonniea]|uniref:hypothetical protein n=1 Tax=Paraburkholderia bonniea TaxID=2152891 RepID=UPI0025729C97|nr:hypothetical protein [Paraburkholderia bonniea]WJF89638.1 hypothetical protein QS306_11040 [Paraburkholderia bonniea]WJF92952.1 hypothetical protein QS308_11050 [Paraburkholderia bonniea]